MKKSLFAWLAALLFFVGCAKTPYTPPIIRPIAPQITAVEKQAGNTTSSAERTVGFARVVETKYKGDQDALNTIKSAEETVIESKKTQSQLAIVREQAEKLDKDAKELEGKYDEAAREVGELKKENQTLKDKVKELIKSLWLHKFYMGALGAVIIGLIILIVKPWKWSIWPF